jgi:hypothetical protein
MSDFFDDVFDNKILFEKEELLKGFSSKLNEEQKLSKEDMSDPALETMMKSLRENPERAFTEKESRVLKEKLTQLKQKSRMLIKNIKDRKSEIDRSVRESSNSFTLDISRNTRLKTCATNTFGGIKNEITYNDYMTLVELKRVIELSETLEIVEGIAENGSI